MEPLGLEEATSLSSRVAQSCHGSAPFDEAESDEPQTPVPPHARAHTPTCGGNEVQKGGGEGEGGGGEEGKKQTIYTNSRSTVPGGRYVIDNMLFALGPLAAS